MPLPTPKNDEKPEAFILRCMDDRVMNEEFPRADQRLAVCETQWQRRTQAMEEFLMIEAQSKTNPRVMGLAYSGGKMNLPGWRYPVVVDLAGLELPDSVPLLTNHENRTGSRVGMVRASVESGALAIEGEITSSNELAQGIVEQAKAGADWQLSIGAEVKDAELVPKGRTREVNGRQLEGPFYHVKAAVLREVSVVAVGADGTTRLKVAARFELTGFQGDDVMGDQTVKANHNSEAKDKPAVEVQPEGKGTVKAASTASGGAAASAATATAPAAAATADVPAVATATTAETSADQASENAGGNKGAVSAAVTPPAVAGQVLPAKIEASAGMAAVPQPAANHGETARTEAERAIKVERDRVTAIQEICAGEFPKLEREAIAAGWNTDQTRIRVLQAIRASRPQADVNLSVAPERTPETTVRRLEAALCFRVGIDEKTLIAAYGEPTVNEAYHDRDVSLQQIFVECAQAEGITVPRHFGNDTIRAAFSTVSLPGLLNNVANKKLLKSFQAQPIIATRLCSEGELTDFKESERYRLTDVGDLEPVAPDGEIKHGGLSEDKATNQLKTYGKTFTLTREMVYNDDLAAFLRVPEGMGARAARKVDQLFFQRLLANPNSLFSVAHKNFKDGADTALSADSLAAAIQMFLDQIDSDKQPINIAPRFLLVPTALKMTAREILNSTILLSVGSTNRQRIPTYNPLSDENLEVVTSPYLSNTNYPGASAKSWYLFADPSVADTFEIGYLRGRRTPTVEQGETDFDTLGQRFRVYYDLGCREQDHRGMVLFKGE